MIKYLIGLLKYTGMMLVLLLVLILPLFFGSTFRPRYMIFLSRSRFPAVHCTILMKARQPELAKGQFPGPVAGLGGLTDGRKNRMKRSTVFTAHWIMRLLLRRIT